MEIKFCGYYIFMKEQSPNYSPRFTFSAEERKALLEKGKSGEEITKMEREATARLRVGKEEIIRERALNDLEKNLGG